MSERIVPTYYADSSTGREYRLTYASISITPISNPWDPLHDGSILTPRDLANWELTIPQYECNCRRFYADWKAANPPDFTSPEAFFAWGVALHNAVNRELSKPEITIEEAYSIWRETDGLDKQEDI